MGYTARAIANYFLDLAERDGHTLSPLKIQKLVFIAHGWHLALLGDPLINDEFAEAWDYGPVFPSIYHAFKEFGRNSIKKRASKLEIKEPLDISVVVPVVAPDDEQTKLLLERVWEAYGRFTGLQLSDMTHAYGTPWEQTRRTAGNFRNVDIPNSIIETHYRRMAEQNRRRHEKQPG